MPQALPIIAGALVKGVLVKAAVVLATSIAVAAYEQDRAKKKAKAAYNASLTDRVFTVRSAVAPRQYVLGTVRTGGVLLHIEPLGSKKEALDSVVAFADNQCELVGYYINEEYLSVGAFPGNKYGKLKQLDQRETFTLTGTSDSVSLATRPISTATAIWTQGVARGIATVTLGIGTAATVSGLPEGDSTVSISYKINSAEKIRTQYKNGDPDQTSTAWSGFSSPLWTAAHRLRGTAHLRTLNIWDEDIYQNGAPSMGAVLKGGPIDGHPIYDPRSGNVSYSDNPAIHAGWWMTLPRERGGCGIPSDWIDWGVIAASANICDELITVRNLSGVGTTQIKRYQCHARIDTDAPPFENLDIILSAMDGRRVFTGGQYRLYAGAFRPASLTLADADVVGTEPISVSTANADDTPPNIVSARFADATKNWIDTSAEAISNTTYIASDGYEEPLSIMLPATTDPRQANYLMGVTLERARPHFYCQLTITGAKGENLALGDTLTLNLSNRSEYAGRTFEVLSITDRIDGNFDVGLEEMRPQFWALDPDTFTPVDPVPIADNSYLWNIPTLTGFEVTVLGAQTLPDGTAVLRVKLQWDAPPSEYIAEGGEIQIRYRSQEGEWISVAPVPGDATSTEITANLLNGEYYQFQARAVNGLGASGNWADAWQQIDGETLPVGRQIRLRPSSLMFHITAAGTVVTPASITLNIDRYGGLTEAAVWSTDPSVTLGGSGDTRTLAYTDLPVDAVTIEVQVTEDAVLYIDTVTIIKLRDGSDSPGYVVDLTPPPSPTLFAGTPGVFHTILEWAEPAYSVGHGHNATIVYGRRYTGGALPTFADATDIGSSNSTMFAHAVGTGETWHYWIKH